MENNCFETVNTTSHTSLETRVSNWCCTRHKNIFPGVVTSTVAHNVCLSCSHCTNNGRSSSAQFDCASFFSKRALHLSETFLICSSRHSMTLPWLLTAVFSSLLSVCYVVQKKARKGKTAFFLLSSLQEVTWTPQLLIRIVNRGSLNVVQSA